MLLVFMSANNITPRCLTEVPLLALDTVIIWAYQKLQIHGFADLIVIGWKKSRRVTVRVMAGIRVRVRNMVRVRVRVSVGLPPDFFQPITIRSANPRIRSFW